MDGIKLFAAWFYKSKAWRECRNGYFLSQHGVCERCGGAGHIVHHRKYITPANISDPGVTLDWRNLELLCDECHQKEHQGTRNTAESVRFNANGDVIQSPPVYGKGKGCQDRVPNLRKPLFSLLSENEVDI